MVVGNFEMVFMCKFLNDIVLVMGLEIFVDVVKYLFMVKFNGLRLGVY